MYLRESKQKRADGSLVVYLQLAENLWNPEKRRAQTRIVCNCGRADDRAVSERLRRLARSILRRCSPQEIVAENPQWWLVCAYPYGPLYVLQALWARLGIDEIIHAQAGSRRLGFNVERALFAMVTNRVCAPASKLYCYEQWLKEDVHIAGTEALGLHQLYRAMDFLEANKEPIEREIFFRVADLCNLDVEVIFYDTTSLHFEIDEQDQGSAADDTVRGSRAAGAKTYRALSTCPKCGTAVDQPIREHTRCIEDIPKVTPLVTAHTVHGYWCSHCKTIVIPKVSAALPRSRLGLRLVVYSAWLHYLVGVSVGNCVKIAAVSLGSQVSRGGLTLAWKNLASLLEGHYDAIGQTIRRSAVLHANETGWRLNGVTCWLWAFATRQYCYYLIDRRRGAAVVKQVLGTLFPGILITDFWGAYNAIETLAKQRCYFHLFTELIKVDKLNASATCKRFRKKLSRLLKDAVRLGEQRQQHPPPTYARRKAKLHKRLDELIAAAFNDADARRLIKRLRRHRAELLTFLDHEAVSPYNNHAEQQMRTAVHTRKVSQQNRSLQGAKTHAIMLSLFRSAQLQGLHPVEYVLQLARAAISGESSGTIAPDQLKKAA